MERKIKIIAGDVIAEASLLNTSTADAIWNSLPIESTCNLWGDEIYFTVPTSQGLEKGAREVVDKGDLGYWRGGLFSGRGARGCRPEGNYRFRFAQGKNPPCIYRC